MSLADITNPSESITTVTNLGAPFREGWIRLARETTAKERKGEIGQ